MTARELIGAWRTRGDGAVLACVAVAVPPLQQRFFRGWLASFARDPNGPLRYDVIVALLDDFSEKDRPLLRALVEAEAGYAERFVYNECFHLVLLGGALLLFKLGHVEDAPLVWRAKRCCFDMQGLLDAQLLCGGGIDATLAYLASVGEPEARDYLEAMVKNGEVDALAAKVVGFESILRMDFELPPLTTPRAEGAT